MSRTPLVVLAIVVCTIWLAVPRIRAIQVPPRWLKRAQILCGSPIGHGAGLAGVHDTRVPARILGRSCGPSCPPASPLEGARELDPERRRGTRRAERHVIGVPRITRSRM